MRPAPAVWPPQKAEIEESTEAIGPVRAVFRGGLGMHAAVSRGRARAANNDRLSNAVNVRRGLRKHMLIGVLLYLQAEFERETAHLTLDRLS